MAEQTMRARLAAALYQANETDRFHDGYTISERMQSVHGGPTDMSYVDAADMILGTPAFEGFAIEREAAAIEEPEGCSCYGGCDDALGGSRHGVES